MHLCDCGFSAKSAGGLASHRRKCQVSDGLRSADRATTLRALKDHVAGRIESADDRDAAALGRLLVAVTDALDAIPQTEGSKTDELARRRAARRRAAASDR